VNVSVVGLPQSTTRPNKASSHTRSRRPVKREPQRTSARDSIAGRQRMFSMLPGSTGLRWRSAELGAGTTRSLKKEYRCGRSLKLLAGLKVPVVSLSQEEAQAHFGWLAMFAGFDMPASSAQTRQRLGWHPTGPRLIADLEQMRWREAVIQ
jgi:hypothetical protein